METFKEYLRKKIEEANPLIQNYINTVKTCNSVESLELNAINEEYNEYLDTNRKFSLLGEATDTLFGNRITQGGSLELTLYLPDFDTDPMYNYWNFEFYINSQKSDCYWNGDTLLPLFNALENFMTNGELPDTIKVEKGFETGGILFARLNSEQPRFYHTLYDFKSEDCVTYVADLLSVIYTHYQMMKVYGNKLAQLAE